jgi:hypothetical protein
MMNFFWNVVSLRQQVPPKQVILICQNTKNSAQYCHYLQSGDLNVQKLGTGTHIKTKKYAKRQIY